MLGRYIYCTCSFYLYDFILFDVVPVASLEGFRAQKSSKLEGFRALKALG